MKTFCFDEHRQEAKRILMHLRLIDHMEEM